MKKFEVILRYLLPGSILFFGFLLIHIQNSLHQLKFDQQTTIGLESRADGLVKHFYDVIEPTTKAVSRIAKRWETSKGTDKRTWTKDSEEYIKDFGFIKALEWVDSSYRIRWVAPLRGNERDLNFNLKTHSDKLQAVKMAEASGESYSSKVFNINEQTKGVSTFFPIVFNGKNQGFILAVYDLKLLFQKAFGQSEFQFWIYEEGALIDSYITDSNDLNKTSKKFVISREVYIQNRVYQVEFRPNSQYLAELEGLGSNGVMYFEIATIVLLFFLSLMFLSLRKKTASRKIALKKNEELKVRLELALDTSGIGVWDYHIKENKLIWDEQMYFIYGINKSSFEGAYEAWAKGLHPGDKERCEKLLSDALKDDNVKFEPQFRVVWPGGDIRFVQAKSRVIRDNSGEAIRMLGVNWDITEQKNSENNLRVAREIAEEALRTRSQFLATMSHEIRTPLNGVLSCANLLLDNVEKKENLKLLRTVQSCGDSLLIIINDILDFSKIEAGKMDLEIHPFDLYDTVEEVIGLLAPKASSSGSTINWNIEKDVPPWILGDVTRFRQILLNLLSNGIKFTKSQIAINIQAKKIGENEYEILTEVKDDGAGMPKEALSKLFKSFSQVDASTTRKFGGTGLGLAICKGLVEAMGGKIWAESEEAQGSVFSFTVICEKALPLEKKQKLRISEINPNLSSEYPIKILMAEDNNVNQMVGRKLIEKLGYRIDIVGNGLEAIEALKHKKYDLILMDQHMPEMDGVEATKIICKEWDKSLRPRITALTASALKEDKDRCFKAGMDGFLTKPIKISEIIEEIKKCKPQSGESTSFDASKPYEAQMIDEKNILEQYGNDAELISEVAKESLKVIPVHIDNIRESIKEQNAQKLQVSAHTLKGILANFFVEKLVDLSFKLEIMGRDNQFEGANPLVDHLISGIKDFELELENLIISGAA